MAGESWLDVGLERFGAGGDVAKAMIERRQLRPQVHDAHIHEAAASRASVIFDGANHCFADSFLLGRGIDRKKAKVSAFAAQFYVNARDYLASLFSNEEKARFQQCSDFPGVGAVAIDEKALHAEGGIDDPDDRVDVGNLGWTGIQSHGYRRSWSRGIVQAWGDFFRLRWDTGNG